MTARRSRSGGALLLGALLPVLAACAAEAPASPPPAPAASQGEPSGGGTADATPIPAPTPDGSPVAPPTGSEDDVHPLGSKWSWGQQDTFDFVAETAGGSTFFEAVWCEVEPTEGERDWTRVDRIVRRTAELEHELMLKIRTGSCWATEGGAGTAQAAQEDAFEGTRKQPSSAPVDVDAYRDFVTELVTRYAAQGVHVYAIENEIDTTNHWTDTFAAYDALARVGAAAVREADPSASVLDGGVSSTAYGVAMAADLIDQDRDAEALEVYQRYYARRQDGGASRFPEVGTVAELSRVLGREAATRAVDATAATTTLAREDVVDAYQLHFYEDPAVLAGLVDWLGEQLPTDVPVQGWEIGVAWPGDGYTEQGHADALPALYAELLGAGVTPIVYLPVAYTDAPGKTPVFRGLVEADGTELAAAAPYRAMVAALRELGPTATPAEQAAAVRDLVPAD